MRRQQKNRQTRKQIMRIQRRAALPSVRQRGPRGFCSLASMICTEGGSVCSPQCSISCFEILLTTSRRSRAAGPSLSPLSGHERQREKRSRWFAATARGPAPGPQPTSVGLEIGGSEELCRGFSTAAVLVNEGTRARAARSAVTAPPCVEK